jgi:hypothetical protein
MKMVTSPLNRHIFSVVGRSTFENEKGNELHVLDISFLENQINRMKYFVKPTPLTPNVMVESVTFLLRIREFADSNLDPEIILTEVFVVFLSRFRQIPG